MPIDPNTLTKPWNLEYMQWPDRVTQAAALAGSAYAAVSGAVIDDEEAWARLHVNGAAFAFVGAAAPTGGTDAGSVFIQNSVIYSVKLGVGTRLWLKRQGTTDRRGSCEVWILRKP